MIRNFIYNFCCFLYLPSADHSVFQFLHSLCSEELYENLYKKHAYKTSFFNSKKLPQKNHYFSYTYQVLEQNCSALKLQVSVTSTFNFNFDDNLFSSSVENYIFILEYSSLNIKVLNIFEEEENPFLYKKTLENSLNLIIKSSCFKNENIFEEKTFKTLGEITGKRKHHKKHSSRISADKGIFNTEAACNYAETYALNSNPDFQTFEGNGGDCTNYASQILNAGGIPLTKTWHPYSNAWIRVNELYSYIINNNIGYELKNLEDFEKGTLIQFYTPQLGHYFHTGFITRELDNGSFLYCCHSYNKLNYPLDAIYPEIYPTVRGIKIK